MRFPRNRYYEELATGLLCTFREMVEVLERDYDFDDFTPMSEVWNYFDLTDIAVEM